MLNWIRFIDSESIYCSLDEKKLRSKTVKNHQIFTRLPTYVLEKDKRWQALNLSSWEDSLESCEDFYFSCFYVLTQPSGARIKFVYHISLMFSFFIPFYVCRKHNISIKPFTKSISDRTTWREGYQNRLPRFRNGMKLWQWNIWYSVVSHIVGALVLFTIIETRIKCESKAKEE